MGIRESALNTIASLANGDFVRMVTAAGASRKASLQTIAQHIIENYTGSTLAGSSQSVKAAIDGLNSNINDSPTIASQSVFTNTGSLIFQAGKVVVVKIEGTLTGSSGGWTTIISDAPKAYGGRSIPTNIITNAGAKVRVRISNTNVQVSFEAAAAGLIGTCFTYIAN